ncbi:unnamed protein product, partial [Protopolystoma xenopodis]
ASSPSVPHTTIPTIPVTSVALTTTSFKCDSLEVAKDAAKLPAEIEVNEVVVPDILSPMALGKEITVRWVLLNSSVYL